jgi:hypothetical protein
VTTKSERRAEQKRAERKADHRRRLEIQHLRIRRDRALAELARREGRDGKGERKPLRGNRAYEKARTAIYEEFQEKIDTLRRKGVRHG